uniref:Retrovirus-related Pol polyprotein from transposon TNT 1-94 n=1 Tax=Cajanus cajan TaxID=3821 RepID=A0A151SBP3_CAJCA|nr:Retrovirus-related Pol polyprotein from transposon TNT 1-94 [Cajanus cajan]
MANGSCATSHGVGTVHLSPSISIDNVLYVSESPFNLLSLSRLTRSLDCLISFTKDSIFLQDRSSERMIGTGCESHGLYHLVSFSPSVPNRALSLFVLVHSDIWGPSRVKSTLEFQYFVTFIDDYSRCTWLFLMKSRSKLFFIFQSFYNEIQTQFGVFIHTFRSDNAREYLSHSFKAFMASHDILHQTSCTYTPRQNGVAECKNRHLIETTCTLLLHGHIPHPFWGDAVLTACYLISRMPSSVLNNQIPHSILFPTQPLHLSTSSHLWIYMFCP